MLPILLLVSACHPSPYLALSPMDYQVAVKEDSTALLIDVRTPIEFKEGHLEGAINLPYYGIGYGHKIDSLDTAVAVYVYCGTAHRSPMVVRVFKKKGFRRVIDLKGGYTAWRRAGLLYSF